jgi:hypothetical protein
MGLGVTGGTLWYRRKYLKLTWKEVFFINKGDDDGSNIQVDLDKDDDDFKDGSERNKKLL